MNSRSAFRRPSLRGIVAVALFGALTVTGCSSAVDQAGAGTEVVEGGVLRIGDSGDLTPATFFSGVPVHAAVSGLVYDTLITYPAGSLEAQPALAQSWTVSEDGLTITLALRPDVKFHDGRPMTSADVQFSLETYADPARSGQLARTAKLITNYARPDDHTIVLTLEHSAGNFFDLLDVVPVIDRNTMADFDLGKAYNGTGAFTFGNWQPGSGITFDANEQYWDGAPNLDGVEYVIVPDAQTRVSQLRSGQLDLLLSAAPRDSALLAGDSNFQVVEQTGVLRNWYIGSNVQAPGLSDIRVRQAIAHAVDRDRILEDVYQGQGSIDNLPWPTYSPAFDASLNTTYNHDVDKAKALVAEVGSIPVIPISYTAGSTETESVAQIIQADLAAVGIETVIEPLDAATSVKHLIGGTYGGLWITSHVFAQYTPATLPTSAYPFNAYKNTSNFIDADYQAATEAVWRVSDPSSPEAIAAYNVLNNELLNNAVVIGLLNAENNLAMSAAVHDVDWSKRSELDLSNAYLSE